MFIEFRLYDCNKFNIAMLEKKSKNDTCVSHFTWHSTVLFAVTGNIISDTLRPNVIATS